MPRGTDRDCRGALRAPWPECQDASGQMRRVAVGDASHAVRPYRYP
jgi:hypothetical protein